MDERFTVGTANVVHNQDDKLAVFFWAEDQLYWLSIAAAREFALAIERAADEAESKLQN